VIADYKATGGNQIDLEKGQLIQVRKKADSGWWEGEVQVKGKKRQIGWFPASYVKPLVGPTSGGSSARSTPDSAVKDPETSMLIITNHALLFEINCFSLYRKSARSLRL
jgi:hypothetical protein